MANLQNQQAHQQFYNSFYSMRQVQIKRILQQTQRKKIQLKQKQIKNQKIQQNIQKIFQETFLKNKLNNKIDTNQVFIQNIQNKQYHCYLPGYFRVKVKNFTEMDLQNLSAVMNATVILTIYYGDMMYFYQGIQEQLQQNIVLLFQRDDPIKLIQDDQNIQTKVKIFKQKKQIQYTLRKQFNLTIQGDIFWSPFQLINLIYSVTVQPIIIDKAQVLLLNEKEKVFKKLIIKINLMDHSNGFLKLSYTQQGTFGNYDLAQQKLQSYYSNDKTCQLKDFNTTDLLVVQNKIQNIIQIIDQIYLKKQKAIKDKLSGNKKSQKILNYMNNFVEKPQVIKAQLHIQLNKKPQKPVFFQYANFNIPLYKYPMVPLSTICIPLWLLGIINLSIFFQEPNLASRIGALATLMIAFVGLIPVIRQQIPPSHNVMFIQYLVYCQSLTTLFVLIHSLNVKDLTVIDLKWNQNGLFMVSLLINVISFIIVLTLILLHYLYWQPNYNKNIHDEKNQNFKRNNWQNNYCNLYFTYFAYKFNVKFQTVQQIIGNDNYSLLINQQQNKKIKKKVKKNQDIMNIKQSY